MSLVGLPVEPGHLLGHAAGIPVEERQDIQASVHDRTVEFSRERLLKDLPSIVETIDVYQQRAKIPVHKRAVGCQPHRFALDLDRLLELA
jgi:hypothetical protein